jgi:uncharacterized protein (TIGR03118 family)
MFNLKLTRAGLETKNRSLFLTVIVILSFGCHKSNVDQKDLRDFKQINLVANSAEYKPVTIDTTLINAFGIAWSPNGIAWVNSVGGHVSELYTSEGGIVRRVNIPSPLDTIGGFPCGIVFSSGKGFNLPNGPSVFLFTGFDGVLSGWNGPSGNNAQRLKAPPGASYTGLAIGSSGGQNFIYGANFGQKKIDVWDTSFSKVSISFKDPTLPDQYSPYNIQAVGDFLFVMYAELNTTGPGAGHAVPGAGKGFVSVFNTDGSFVRRFASQGTLNIPWGVTMAQGSFLEDKDMGEDDGEDNSQKIGKNNNGNDQTSNHGKHDPKDPVILVGNFGDGHINVYSQDGSFLGQLHSHNQTIVIEGLWALSFPPSSASIDPARLYFTAGPDNESDGVYGYLIKQ